MGLDETQGFLRAALGGADTARGDLLEHLRPRLVLWTAGRLSAALRAQVEPEDVAQDILLAVHKDFSGFQGEDTRGFFKWFFTVAENRIRDLADHYGALKRQLPPPLSFSQTSPSNAAARSEQVTLMMAAIARLPEDHRQVIVLRKIEERPAGEVALILGRSENAVGILLCRALKQLSEALRAEKLAGSDGSAPTLPS